MSKFSQGLRPWTPLTHMVRFAQALRANLRRRKAAARKDDDAELRAEREEERKAERELDTISTDKEGQLIAKAGRADDLAKEIGELKSAMAEREAVLKDEREKGEADRTKITAMAAKNERLERMVEQLKQSEDREFR